MLAKPNKEVVTPCFTAVTDGTKVGHQSCSHVGDLRIVTKAFGCVATGMSCHIAIPCLILARTAPQGSQKTRRPSLQLGTLATLSDF